MAEDNANSNPSSAASADGGLLRIAVCLSHFHPTVGGAERQLFQLAERWARWGHEPLVITRRLDGQPACEIVSGIEIRRTITTVSAGPLFGLTFLASLTAHLVRYARRYDAVLAGQAPWEAVAAGLAAPLLGKPSIVRLASVGPRGDVAQLRRAKGSGLWRRLALRNGLFLAPSEAACQELAELGCPAERIRRFTNGVDVERFRPPGEQDAGAAAERDRTVIFVGRLSEEKNPRAVLRVWKKLNGIGRHRLLMVGGGPQAESLAAYARQESLNNVEFLGQRSDVPDLYRQAAVCVQPSPHEGCSNALLEAMASGVCPVVSRVPGNLELVEHGVNGLTVALDDDEAWATTLARVLEDVSLRQRLSQAARQRVIERHDLDRIARDYLELFAELL
ncbi:MAG TPA: glycosyltransferase family 4 protein [Pirellulales bacterium]|nr:glycosyltransferase family 4 protein [Pirellulales bacterium]